MNLSDYIESVNQSPIPRNPMAKIRTLAKELAGGATYGLWSFRIVAWLKAIDEKDPPTEGLIPDDPSIKTYLTERWDGYANVPDLMLLERLGYLSEQSSNRFSIDYLLTQAAFQLLEEVEPTKIFISYKRSESSAFALLVMNMLKNVGLNPFLDLSLIPGEDWSSGLKQHIEHADYLVLLLGHDTLSSKIVREEIRWAQEKSKIIIPIWHSGFIYQSTDWTDLADPIDTMLSMTHTIRVLEENPLAYHNAILELLNRLGYTP